MRRLSDAHTESAVNPIYVMRLIDSLECGRWLETREFGSTIRVLDMQCRTCLFHHCKYY